ncbi:hypothetical protein TWF694_000320 [Orbilia ellipsospora]|uniref:Uncharacterized protein n=1 Tax=Orbilia ellipsospora TaxID=2528407 RepID=A0AAV9XQ05_9PEZI
MSVYITEITITNATLPTLSVTPNPQGKKLPSCSGDHYLSLETTLPPSTPLIHSTQLVNNVWFPREGDATPSSANTSELIHLTPLILPALRNVSMQVKVAGLPSDWSGGATMYFSVKNATSPTYLFPGGANGFQGSLNADSVFEFTVPLTGLELQEPVFSSFGGQVEVVVHSPLEMMDIKLDVLAQYMMEIYWVQPTLPPGFASGIPLQLLRLFLGPRSTFNNYTEEAWQNIVAGVIFGSLEPETLKQKTQDQFSDHWLKYDMIAGGDNFRHSATNGLEDILAAWLNCYRAWRDNDHKYYASVNCYDQADMVELALSLGIPYTRTVLEYYQPFGFIDTNLVGWGSVNSPYFGGDLSQKVITASKGDYFDLNTPSTPLAKAPEDPKFPAQRTQFRNHQYVAVLPPGCTRPSSYPKEGLNVLGNPGNIPEFANRVIIDACAGPLICKTFNDYYKNIEPAIKPLDDKNSYTPEQCWSTRTNNNFFNKPDVRIDTIEDQYNKFFDRKDFDVSFEKIQTQAETLTGIYQGNLSDLTGAFQTAFETYKVKVTLPGVHGENPDYVFQTVTPASDEGGTYVKFETRAWQPGKASHTYISCGFIFCDNLDTALSHLQKKLKDIAEPQSWDTKHLGLWSQKQAVDDTTVWVLGSEYLKLFVVKNVLVELRTMASLSGSNSKEPGSVTDFQQGSDNSLNSIASAILAKMKSADTATTSNGWTQSFANVPGVPATLQS